MFWCEGPEEDGRLGEVVLLYDSGILVAMLVVVVAVSVKLDMPVLGMVVVIVAVPVKLDELENSTMLSGIGKCQPGP